MLWPSMPTALPAATLPADRTRRLRSRTRKCTLRVNAPANCLCPRTVQVPCTEPEIYLLTSLSSLFCCVLGWLHLILAALYRQYEMQGLSLIHMLPALRVSSLSFASGARCRESGPCGRRVCRPGAVSACYTSRLKPGPCGRRVCGPGGLQGFHASSLDASALWQARWRAWCSAWCRRRWTC